MIKIYTSTNCVYCKKIKKFLNDKKIVYEEKDLVNLGINFRRETFLREFYRKYYNEILFDDNERIRNLKKRIEEWLK